jgi:hypothetical protein
VNASLACGAVAALLALPAYAEEPAGPPRPVLVGAGAETDIGGAHFDATAWLGGRLESASAFPLDSDGNELSPDLVLNTIVRLGLRFDSLMDWKPVRLLVEYEHDLFSGPVYGGPGEAPEAVYLPYSGGYDEQTLRKAFARLSVGPYVTVGGGFTTSHWGLGLLANDGAHRFRPGSASFVDPRGGDVVARALLATGPHTDAGLTVFAAYDDVFTDDVLYPGDEAWQVVGGASVGAEKPWGAGVYGVYREQTARDGDATKVGVIDVFGRYRHALDPTSFIEVAAEGAVVFGTTTLGPSPDHPEHEVLQLGGTLHFAADFGIAGAVLDLTYASGDRNYDDGAQNAFRADINHEQGLLLYRWVLAAQTARAAVTAANPDLVGLPSEDLDRIPTRGNVTNTIAIFPRGWVRPVDGLEIYGGPLIAFSEVGFADPLHTRLAGGSVRNPFDREPGGYLGTEFDLGARFRVLVYGVELEVGAEGGVLLPGTAFEGADTDPVWGGRAMLGLAL